jgi:hypothetical protein
MILKAEYADPRLTEFDSRNRLSWKTRIVNSCPSCRYRTRRQYLRKVVFGY